MLSLPRFPGVHCCGEPPTRSGDKLIVNRIRSGIHGRLIFIGASRLCVCLMFSCWREQLCKRPCQMIGKLSTELCRHSTPHRLELIVGQARSKRYFVMGSVQFANQSNLIDLPGAVQFHCINDFEILIGPDELARHSTVTFLSRSFG